jgi:hypothetical protein
VKGRAKGLVSEEEANLLEKTNEWDRAEFIRQRMKNKGYAVPINSAQDERDSIRKDLPAEKPAAPYIPLSEQKKQTEQWKRDQGKISKTEPTPTEAQGSPEEWKSPDAEARPPSPGIQTEMSPVSSAGPGMSPLANAMQMATGATGNPMLDDIQEVAQPVVDSVKSQLAGPPIEQQPGIVPSLYRAGQAISNSPVGDIARSIAAPDKGAFPGVITNEQAATLPPSPNMGVPGIASPEAPPLPPEAGSMSASASVRVPGGFKAVKDNSMEGWDAEVGASKKRLDDLASHLEGADIVQQGLTRKASERRLETDQVMAIEAEYASKAKLNAINEARRYESAKSVALQAARDAAATPTDPNRYWNNKTAGQQAAAVIAGALFGFTGQGMNWLQRIDGLIENDMRAQMADRSAKVAGMEAEARGMGEAADFAMKAGASEAESHILARQMKFEGLQSYLADITAKQTDMAKKTQGLMMLQEMSAKNAQFDLQGRELTSQTIARQNAVLADQAKLAQKAVAISARAAKGGKDGKRPPGIRNELAKIQAGLQAVKEARDAVGKGVSFTDAMALTLGDALRKVGASGVANFVTPDTSGRSASADTAQENVLKAVKGENLLEADLSRALPRFKRPGLAAENNAWLDAQEQILKAKQNSLLTNETEDGMDGTPLPEAADDFGFEAAQ